MSFGVEEALLRVDIVPFNDTTNGQKRWGHHNKAVIGGDIEGNIREELFPYE